MAVQLIKAQRIQKAQVETVKTEKTELVLANVLMSEKRVGFSGRAD